MPSSPDPASICVEMLTLPVFVLLGVAGALASPRRTDAYGNVRMSAWNAVQIPIAGPPVPYYNPVDNGGTMFDNTGNGLGEPLNVSKPSLLEPDKSLTPPIGYHFWFELAGGHRQRSGRHPELCTCDRLVSAATTTLTSMCDVLRSCV